MGADTAAIAGVADHEVVQPNIGHEPKAGQQIMGGVELGIDALNQQTPGAPGARWQLVALEGAVLQGPAAPAQADQTRFDVVLAGQLNERIARQQRLETGDGVADEQRLALPVVAHELVYTHAAQRRGGVLHGVSL